jgi:hypothetical protein
MLHITWLNAGFAILSDCGLFDCLTLLDIDGDYSRVLDLFDKHHGRVFIVEHAQVTTEFRQSMAKDLICFETWVQWSNLFCSAFSDVGHVPVGGHVGQSSIKLKCIPLYI